MPTLCRKTGVRVVRMGEFAWSRFESNEGDFDFNWLDEIISMFAERGIDVVLCTPNSAEQEYAFKIQPQTEGMYYYQQLKLYHDAFSRYGVNIDIINWTENLSKYKIVVAPTLYINNQKVYDSNFYNGKSAVTKNIYKKGTAYYIGTVLKKAFYYDLIKQILNEDIKIIIC